MSASANSQALVGLDIAPTFATGSFTGTTNAVARFNGTTQGFIFADYTTTTNFALYPKVTPSVTNYLLRSDATNIVVNAPVSSGGIFFTLANNGYGRFHGVTGNFTLQNGGTLTDAGFRLDVSGSARITGTSATPLLVERTGSPSNINIQFKNDTTSLYAGQMSNSTFGIGPSNNLVTTSQLSVFTTTGNVVIQNGGTPTDTGYRLDVSGSARITNGLTVTGSLNITGSITSSGDIVPSLNNTYNLGTSANNFNIIYSSFLAGAGLFTINTYNGNSQQWQVSGVNKMQLFGSSGNLLIQNGGTFTDNGYRLQVSGSARITNGLTVTGSLIAPSITGSLFGTASFATTASYASNGGVTQIVAGTNITITNGGSGSVTINSSGGGGAAFPYTGSAQITGSLIVTGSTTSTQGFIKPGAGSQYLLADGTTTASTGGSLFPFTGSAQITGSLNVVGPTSITGSLTQGLGNITSGSYSHAEGSSNQALGLYSHAEGIATEAQGTGSHAEGYNTVASGLYSHAEGRGYEVEYSYDTLSTLAIEFGPVPNSTVTSMATDQVTVVGNYLSSITSFPYTLPNLTLNNGEDQFYVVNADFSINAHLPIPVISSSSFSSGQTTFFFSTPLKNTYYQLLSSGYASGLYSHVEGNATKATGTGSHAEGYNTQATGIYSHAEGQSTIASGSYSHAEGYETIASGLGSHAEGYLTIASGSLSHAEGEGTQALGPESHAEGYYTVASGFHSHAEGNQTVASGSYQHVQGQFNISSSAQSAFIIGNGTSNSNRKNLAFASGSTFQVTGSLNVSGSITLNGSSITGGGGGGGGVTSITAGANVQVSSTTGDVIVSALITDLGRSQAFYQGLQNIF